MGAAEEAVNSNMAEAHLQRCLRDKGVPVAGFLMEPGCQPVVDRINKQSVCTRATNYVKRGWANCQSLPQFVGNEVSKAWQKITGRRRLLSPPFRALAEATRAARELLHQQ